MPTETTTATSWPTGVELDGLEIPHHQAVEEMAWIVGRMEQIDDEMNRSKDVQPTAAEFGELAAFIARVEHSLSVMEGYLEIVRRVQNLAAAGGFSDAR